VLSIAGLWDQWKEPETGETISSATLIVTAANDITRRIHDRMPVLLDQNDLDAWLTAGSDATFPSKIRVPSLSRMQTLVSPSDTSNPTNVSMAALLWFDTDVGSTSFEESRRD